MDDQNQWLIGTLSLTQKQLSIILGRLPTMPVYFGEDDRRAELETVVTAGLEVVEGWLDELDPGWCKSDAPYWLRRMTERSSNV